MFDQRAGFGKVAAGNRAKTARPHRHPPFSRRRGVTPYFNAVASDCSFATRLVPSA